MTDPNRLTPTELHAVQSLLNAVKQHRDDEARWWSERPALLAAIAKMKASSKENTQ